MQEAFVTECSKKLRTLIIALVFAFGGQNSVEAAYLFKENCPSGVSPELQVSFLAVGQGDSILIRCPGRKEGLLVDAGPSDKLYPGAERLLLESLRHSGVHPSSIRTALITHPHPDHFGGLDTLVSLPEGAISKVLESGLKNPNDSSWDELRGRLLAREIRFDQISNSRVGQLCGAVGNPNLTVDLIDPWTTNPKVSCPDLNNCSSVIRFDYFGYSMLLAADAGVLWEQAALASAQTRERLASTLLKVGHHASRFSTSKDFLDAVKPAIAVVSVGEPGLGTTGLHGYPDEATVGRLVNYMGQQAPLFGKRRVVKVCQWVNGGCEWKEREIHARLLFTPDLGTITVSVNRAGMCVRSSESGELFHVRKG